MLRSKKSYELAIHFNKFLHALKDISFTVIEQIENTTGDLDRIFSYAGELLGGTTLHLKPFGLNKRYEFRSKKRFNYKH